MIKSTAVLPDSDNKVRFYSLARYALLDALRAADVRPGQKVLVPEFLCRDLLAPLSILHITPVWYGVNAELEPITPSVDWPLAAAVLSVNYFGFAQDLSPFRNYVARSGAVLIEDNAHGFLSRDDDGNWLGLRASYGVFSIRKTLRIPDGAALVVNDPRGQERLPPPLYFNGPGLNLAQRHKAKMRRIPMFGGALLRTSTVLARQIRKLRTGRELPKPDPYSETELPTGANPWCGLHGALRNVDVHAEILRRREAYAACAELAARAGVDPVFKELPVHCAPYGFPFRSNPAGRQIMQGFADRLGFDLVTWPDLPGVIVEQAPEHYRNVLIVNFLW
jgi:hypothetical protein